MKVTDFECPECKHRELQVEVVFQAVPLTRSALPGAQIKFSAKQVPQLSCRNCLWSQCGEFDGEDAVFAVTEKVESCD